MSQHLPNFRYSVIAILIFTLKALNAQVQFTPYDDIPGVIKSYKPVYNETLPDWGKMLYAFPLNYNEVNNAYTAYVAANGDIKNGLSRYFKIWKRAVQKFADEQGNIVLPDMEKYYRDINEARLENKIVPRDNKSNWTFLGPKETHFLNESGTNAVPIACPWQVNVYAIDVSKSNPNILFAGTETGFVNKSIDKGLNWIQQGQNYFFGGGVTAVAIDPVNPDVVYAAAGKQINKSIDGGSNWKPMLKSQLFQADRIIIDSKNGQNIFAASADGLFTSNDEGNTWTRVWNVATYDVELKPNDSNVVYALSKSSNQYRIIGSIDGGKTFENMLAFPQSYTVVEGGLLATTEANGNALFAFLLSSNDTPYLLKGNIVNGTWTWKEVSKGNTTNFASDNGQGYYDVVLDVAPDNENIIYAGTSTLYKSTNGGTSFSIIGGYGGNYSIHPDMQDIKVLKNGEVWLATDGGVNYSSDNFSSQAKYKARVNGLIGCDFWGFDQGWNEDIVVGGRYHNGNTAIADFYQPKALRMGGAESPTGWVLQGRSRHVAFDDLGNGWILPSKVEDNPEGRFLFTKFPNMEEYGGRRSNIVTHPNYFGTMFLGNGNSIWKTEDSGVTWSMINTFSGKVLYMQMSYSNPDVIYADIVGKGLYKTIDGGKNWIQKPSLTSSTNGGSYWNGKLFFAISPTNENTIYACLQNGTWSEDLGRIFMSKDGGDTWTNFTGSVNDYLKNIVVTSSTSEEDIIYLFSNSSKSQSGKIYYRTASMADWQAFDNNYPHGIDINLALPFYRDGKLRLAGNAGIWESPLQDENFTPILNPWVEKAKYSCFNDTVYLDDHSLINHKNTTWQWEVSPSPIYMSNAKIRNPKVVVGKPGEYDVTMTVNQDGKTYSKTIKKMFSATTCPSVDDCNNPASLDKKVWSLLSFDSEEINDQGLASMAIDGDPATIWHTAWTTGDAPYPHEIEVGLNNEYNLFSFTYQTRQDGVNGRIKDYELYISNDPLDWGSAIKKGQFINTSAPQIVSLDNGVSGQYFKLVALSEVNGGPWASAAELSFVGCLKSSTASKDEQLFKDLNAYPTPSSGKIFIDIPSTSKAASYVISALSGQVIAKGKTTLSNGIELDITNQNAGMYLVKIVDDRGKVFRVKVVKE